MRISDWSSDVCSSDLTTLDMIQPLNRMALGFYEQDINGHDVIAHGGDTQWFHSYLWLFPEQDVGLYVSVNSAGRDGAAGAIRSALFDQFADRYLDRKSTRLNSSH